MTLFIQYGFLRFNAGRTRKFSHGIWNEQTSSEVVNEVMLDERWLSADDDALREFLITPRRTLWRRV